MKFLALICPILGKTEEAKAKYENYLKYASTDGALAPLGGWTGTDLDVYGEDEELRHAESNTMR